ncbi:MAG TPA: (2Fe-2S)-binding protein [Candidatus Limnocylindria bacterium]|nr:(2Fe-2S)-binding protein [Candidatus Limnocylindria bacterium]
MKVTTTLRVNGQLVQSPADPETPLLYVLRNDLGLKGTRFGCGVGLCGACTVQVDGVATASCNLPISALGDRWVTTIESLGDEARLHPLQQAFLDEQAGQCGYCLTGVLMTAAALLDSNPDPSRAEIRSALDGVLCRCGVQDRMVRAVERAAAQLRVQP